MELLPKIKVFYYVLFKLMRLSQTINKNIKFKHLTHKCLLIGKDYWNFVCNDENGFDIVFDQYKTTSQYIKDSLTRIRNKYGCQMQAFACIFFIRKRMQLSIKTDTLPQVCV